MVQYDSSISLALLSNREELASLIASFAFTSLGFLAAIITVLFSLAGSSVFAQYARVGNLEVFFFFYFFVIVNLVLTSLFSILGFSEHDVIWIFHFLLIIFVNNLVQVGLIALIVTNLSRRAAHEIS
ncbi:MAG: hypothetical protein CMN27_01005 [Salinisphaera sp.]|nr:hypothetical protein [Salinisphaera sp.]